ncbi:hypothetical protein QYE76_020781 [Lolium multiflorum]|uniref:CCHC-type domain-containing protein n=1 Tax=Lolium multiflorum TaxID=4521 RepID=A0AAD8R8E9_LOLMU|nr:hypothetical protein QYE76_020781 [Lolium multiflorum]
MMQMLQMMMEDREATRAERQANLAALQQIAQNNQGHGNHDHPGSKLKNFQNTNPPMFSKTEEPLDADDWLQTMENNWKLRSRSRRESTVRHPLSVRTCKSLVDKCRAMNAGQMMNFKLKFSKYHVPQGLIKKMRDEFRELKQGRMSVVEYRDKFLTLSSNPNNTNNHPNGNNNNPNNAPKTGSNTVPINPKDKSTINCYECGVVGHYSNECPKKLARIAANTAAPASNAASQPSPARTTLPNLLYTLPRSCQTPASTFWCVTRAGTGTPRRARNVHAHARARTACVADAPGHVVAPPAPSLPLFSLCARRTTTTPATPWTRLPGRGNPVHHAMADAIRQGTRVHGDDADAPVLQFQRQHARRVHSDVANTAAPPPLTLTYRSHADVDDLPRSTRPPRAAIKGGIPWMISSHLSTPHSLLSPLDLLPLHIAARSRQISRRSPRRC